MQATVPHGSGRYSSSRAFFSHQPSAHSLLLSNSPILQLSRLGPSRGLMVKDEVHPLWHGMGCLTAWPHNAFRPRLLAFFTAWPASQPQRAAGHFPSARSPFLPPPPAPAIAQPQSSPRRVWPEASYPPFRESSHATSSEQPFLTFPMEISPFLPFRLRSHLRYSPCHIML